MGMAMAEAHMAATFNQADAELVNNYTYVIAGDGCMQEGVASEAASLAGYLVCSSPRMLMVVVGTWGSAS